MDGTGLHPQQLPGSSVWPLTEEEATDYNNLEDELEEEASIKIKTSPGNGLTTKNLKANRCPMISGEEWRASYLRRRRKSQSTLKQTAGTSSTVFAAAVIKLAESSTRIFVNKKTLQCATHKERNFHMDGGPPQNINEEHHHCRHQYHLHTHYGKCTRTD